MPSTIISTRAARTASAKSNVNRLPPEEWQAEIAKMTRSRARPDLHRGPATHPRRPYPECRRLVVEMRDTLAPVHRVRPTTKLCWAIWMQFPAHSDALPLVCLQAIPRGRDG